MSAQTPTNTDGSVDEIPVLVKLDPTKPIFDQDVAGVHNRWHPDIPAIATVEPGEAFKLQCIEATGGQVGYQQGPDPGDLNKANLDKLHVLSGPIAVQGAEPGDCLVVDILDVSPDSRTPWGFTGFLDDGGLLCKEDPFHGFTGKAVWDIDGAFATCGSIKGTRIMGIPHPGVIGTAPSKELLEEWTGREKKIFDSDPEREPPLAFLPKEAGAHIGQKLDDDLLKNIKENGARTIPGRENGGNADIKNLSKGSRCYFPVFVKGGNVSVGDVHFSQGDGEIAWCGAIEMSAVVTCRMGIIKNGIERFALKQPIFISSPIDPLYSRKLVFQGLSADIEKKDKDDGKKNYMAATAAFKQAVHSIMHYLGEFGYDPIQVYLLLSAVPIDSRVAAVVDSPNVCVTIGLPTGIFDMDIMPDAPRPKEKEPGRLGKVPIVSRGKRSRYSHTGQHEDN